MVTNTENNNDNKKPEPRVSLIICTFNRRKYLAQALKSAINQTHRNLQIILVNDGGQDVGDIVEAINDPRIIFINRKENRGYAASLNEALSYADGKYIAYLGDDDFHYPNHIKLLAGALEGQSSCQAAYTNLLRTMFRLQPDGSRIALGKSLEVRRDFDRFFMFHFNQTLGGSLMHTRDILTKTGPYNEDIGVLIDWDMTRRLVFFTDFIHVRQITGEYCAPVNSPSDRLSQVKRQDTNAFARNVVAVRTSRPPKPWPKVKDLSIIFTPDKMDHQTAEMLRDMVIHTFVPNLIYLALPAEELAKLDSGQMPTIIPVPVPPQASEAERFDLALAQCSPDLIAVVNKGQPIADNWIEQAVHPFWRKPYPRQGFLTAATQEHHWGAVLNREDIVAAREKYPHLPVRESIESAGIVVRKAQRKELPMMLDELLSITKALEDNGNWDEARKIYEKAPDVISHETWMTERQAEACYRTGRNDDRAMELCHQVNHSDPTPDTLLLEAKIHRRANEIDQAIKCLQLAGEQLQWKG